MLLPWFQNGIGTHLECISKHQFNFFFRQTKNEESFINENGL